MKYNILNIRILFLLLLCSRFISYGQQIFIEAENFDDRGGWVVDQQSIDIIGSSYLMAHGLGVPVQDATTTVQIPQNGNYRVWVRTRNWAAPWAPAADPPGNSCYCLTASPCQPCLELKVPTGIGRMEGRLPRKGELRLSLHIMTGFNGRCDAILLTTDHRLSLQTTTEIWPVSEGGLSTRKKPILPANMSWWLSAVELPESLQPSLLQEWA